MNHFHTHTHETKRNTKMSATWNELRRMNHFGFRDIFQNENRARKWERRQNLFWIQMKREKIDVFDESMPFFSLCVASQWWPNLKQQQLAEKQKKPKERIVRARAHLRCIDTLVARIPMNGNVWEFFIANKSVANFLF